MKLIFVAALILTCSISIAQKKAGFVYLGPAGYHPIKANKGGKDMFGGSLGFGVYTGIASLGIGVDLLSQTKNGFLGNAYADLRVRIVKAPVSPFILFQPGLVLRNENSAIAPGSVTNERGNLFLAGGAGVTAKTKKIGVTFQIKAAMISTKVVVKNNGAVKSQGYQRPGYIGASIGIVY